MEERALVKDTAISQALGQVGGLSDEKPPYRQCFNPGEMSATPESSSQVHSVTVTMFMELDALPNLQKTTHFSGDPISKHVSHPHKGRVQKGRTRDLWSRRSTGKCLARGKCSPAPTRKSQCERGPAGRTYAQGQVFSWGIRPALSLGCYETCFG